MVLNQKNWIKILAASLLMMVSCKAIRSEQTVYFEDSDMDFSAHHEQMLEANIYSYREAAVGGTKGKSGGGCGCN